MGRNEGEGKGAPRMSRQSKQERREDLSKLMHDREKVRQNEVSCVDTSQSSSMRWFFGGGIGIGIGIGGKGKGREREGKGKGWEGGGWTRTRMRMRRDKRNANPHPCRTKAQHNTSFLFACCCVPVWDKNACYARVFWAHLWNVPQRAKKVSTSTKCGRTRKELVLITKCARVNDRGGVTKDGGKTKQEVRRSC